MTFRPNRIDRVADELTEVSQDLREIIADGEVTPAEVDRLLELSQKLHEKAEDVESVAIDMKAIQQIARIGHENYPDRNLAPAIVGLQTARRCNGKSKSPARLQPSGLRTVRMNGSR